MKKIILFTAIIISLGVLVSSCGASRKTGCPMNEKIIH